MNYIVSHYFQRFFLIFRRLKTIIIVSTKISGTHLVCSKRKRKRKQPRDVTKYSIYLKLTNIGN